MSGEAPCTCGGTPGPNHFDVSGNCRRGEHTHCPGELFTATSWHWYCACLCHPEPEQRGPQPFVDANGQALATLRKARLRACPSPAPARDTTRGEQR